MLKQPTQARSDIFLANVAVTITSRTMSRKRYAAVGSILALSGYACSELSAPTAPSTPRLETTGLRGVLIDDKHVLKLSNSPFGCGVSHRALSGPMKYVYTNMRFHGGPMHAEPGTPTLKLRLVFEDGSATPAGAAICSVPNTPEAIAFALKHLVKAGAKPTHIKGPQQALGAAAGHGSGSNIHCDVLPNILVTAPWTYFDWSEVVSSYFDFFDLNAYSVGDSGGGDVPYYDPSDGVADCSVDPASVVDLPIYSLPDESLMDFDCRKVQCPSGLAIVNAPAVVDATKDMIRQMQDDPQHIERGAWIFMDSERRIAVGVVDPDGTVRPGRMYVGTNDCLYGPSCVKQLYPEPDNLQPGWYIIGTLHTHPYESGPSGNDQVNAIYNHDYAIVATSKNIYESSATGVPLYQCPRAAWGSCTAP